MRRELSRILRNQPFVPFTIRANDGRSFEISHVGFCLVTSNAAYIYREDNDEVVRLAFPAITSLDSDETAA